MTMTEHATQYRIRIIHDDDGEIETPTGTPLPGTKEDYAKSPIYTLLDPTDDPVTGTRRRVGYLEYCRYWGNPERHVLLGVVIDRRCGHCGQWDKNVQSLWGIDHMDDDPEAVWEGKTISGDDVETLPGYLKEVARELLEEAKGMPMEGPLEAAKGVVQEV